MTAQTLRSGRAAILYDDALLSHADETLFSAEHWARRGALRQAAGGRGKTLIVTAPGGEWVIRHYRRGGLPARLNRDRYVWTGLERSRPWREWQLLADLYKGGLPVPQPVAARVRVAGPFYRGDLITRCIPDTHSLFHLVKESGETAVPWESVGVCIRRFHAAGVLHADLNGHNVLLDKQGGVFLIDFDRGQRRASGGHWQASNLRRLRHSLHKAARDGQLGGDSWERFLDGYREGG